MPLTKPGSLDRAVLGATLALGLALGSAGLGHHLATQERAGMPPDENVLFLPRPAAISALSLGLHELAADLIYIRAVIYFGTEVTGNKDFRWLENLLQTTVELDPRWKTPYRWAGVATMYNGMPITQAKVRASSRFLRLGIEHFPRDWELAFMLGCNLLFETKAKDPKERAVLTAEGAEWIRRAALVGGAPSWASLLAATILRKEGREDAALRHLEQVYYSTSDERTREQVKGRLLSLKAKIDFERESRDRARFESSWKASLPYAPVELFVLIGARPEASLDWRRLVAPPGAEHLDPSDDAAH